MNVTLRQLQAFVLVARLGSFTRAAQAMHLTQSALSVLVRELESSMNTRLLDRTTRAVELTVAGSEFFPEAERILGDLERAIANVDKLMAKEKGKVVVAAPLVLSSSYLPPILSGFRARYPGIELVLHDTLPAQVLPQVRSGTADIGIGTFAATESDLQRKVLFTEAMVAIFPVAHPLAARKRITWDDLAAHPIVALRRGSVFRDLAEVGFSSAGVDWEPSFEAEYAGTVIGLVDAGMGVAILPGYAAKLSDSSRLRWQRIEKPVVDREVSLVLRAGPAPSPAAQAFVEFICAVPVGTGSSR
ncbi:MAG TPA: LysR family transcriptional regulator [Ramlibacter sp.]|nr:LysR family transcriptional regulator [Ramlibacter sp.]